MILLQNYGNERNTQLLLQAVRQRHPGKTSFLSVWRIRIPHHVDADSDPSFYFDAETGPTPL
jgi:hypothetical protein